MRVVGRFFRVCVGWFLVLCLGFRRRSMLLIRLFRLQGRIVVAGIEGILWFRVLLVVVVSIGVVRRRSWRRWIGWPRSAGENLPVDTVASARGACGE